MSPLKAFTQLYENWPMQPAYRKQAWQTLKAAVLAQQTTNSAMDAIVLIKEVAERMNQSTNDGCSISLCACHGLGARIVELAQQHQ